MPEASCEEQSPRNVSFCVVSLHEVPTHSILLFGYWRQIDKQKQLLLRKTSGSLGKLRVSGLILQQLKVFQGKKMCGGSNSNREVLFSTTSATCLHSFHHCISWLFSSNKSFSQCPYLICDKKVQISQPFLSLVNTMCTCAQFHCLKWDPHMESEWPIIFMSIQSNLRIKLIPDLITICWKLIGKCSVSD